LHTNNDLGSVYPWL